MAEFYEGGREMNGCSVRVEGVGREVREEGCAEKSWGLVEAGRGGGR